MKFFNASFEDTKKVDAVASKNSELKMNPQKLEEKCDTMEKGLRNQQEIIRNCKKCLRNVNL